MSARKEQHSGFPFLCGLSVVLFLLVLLGTGERVFAAGSPFELKIRDLEQGDAVTSEVKKPHSLSSGQPHGSEVSSAPSVKVEAPREGDFVRYTIRSGDNIYTILTNRFGLSANKAERLIPEVMRINGIVDTSGLQIGQTLLLPLAGKKAVVLPKKAPVEAPVPPPEPVPPAVVEPPAPVASPAPSPGVDEGMLRRAKEFWVRLFPGRKPLGTVPGKGKTGPVCEPLLVGLNGKEIRIVPPATPAVFANLSGAGAAKGETVVADPANEKGFVKELLQAAGFAVTDGGAPLEFGTEPKLSLKVDFTAAQRLPGAEERKTILVLREKNGCQKLPESFVSYLSAKDFRLVAWCDASESSPFSAAVHVHSVPSGSSDATLDSVLADLGIQAIKDFPIEIQVGQSGAASLKVTVDRYFEGEGKRFFVDLGNDTPNRATLFRLLELAGYQRIAVVGTDTLRTISAKISAALNIPADYHSYHLTSLPDGFFTLDITGILFQQPGSAGVKIFLTNGPVDQPFFDLLNDLPWGTQ